RAGDPGDPAALRLRVVRRVLLGGPDLRDAGTRPRRPAARARAGRRRSSMNASNDVRAFLRHATAVIAYRGAKTLRGAPPEFAHFKASPTTRTPLEILAHIGDLLEVSAARLRGPAQWKQAKPDSWEQQVARFHAALA